MLSNPKCLLRPLTVSVVVWVGSQTGVLAQCAPAQEFASVGAKPSGADQVSVDPGAAENAGNEIGRFWGSSDSNNLNDLVGTCPSTNPLSSSLSWWKLTEPPLRGINGWIGASDSYGQVCTASSCPYPLGDLTVVVEDRSALGDDALFIGFRVDATPAQVRPWDLSRVDPAPSPSVLTMRTFPVPIVVHTMHLPSGDVALDFEYPDIAPNVHAVAGWPANAPQPASSIVASYDLYRHVGAADPGRATDAWMLVESQPYTDGPGARFGLTLDCPPGPDHLFLALGISFEGGVGPDVPSKLVGRSVLVDCSSNSAPLANAGPDRTVECSAAGGSPVTFDGGQALDPEGDSLDFVWSAPGVTFDDPSSITPSAVFPLGTTLVTLTVSDGEFATTDTVQVTVEDTIAPQITCALVPSADGDDDDEDQAEGQGGGAGQQLVQVSTQDLCCAGTTSAVIDAGWALLPVSDGQSLGLHCNKGGSGEASGCESVKSCNGQMDIHVSDATLVAESWDCSGNRATCAVSLCVGKGKAGSGIETESTVSPGAIAKPMPKANPDPEANAHGSPLKATTRPPSRRR